MSGACRYLSIVRWSETEIVVLLCQVRRCKEVVVWMSSVIAEFIKQPVVRILHQFVERRKVWLAVAGAFAAAEERVDAMTVRRRDEAAPRWAFIHSFLYCQQMSKRIRCYVWHGTHSDDRLFNKLCNNTFRRTAAWRRRLTATHTYTHINSIRQISISIYFEGRVGFLCCCITATSDWGI